MYRIRYRHCSESFFMFEKDNSFLMDCSSCSGVLFFFFFLIKVVDWIGQGCCSNRWCCKNSQQGLHSPGNYLQCPFKLYLDWYFLSGLCHDTSAHLEMSVQDVPVHTCSLAQLVLRMCARCGLWLTCGTFVCLLALLFGAHEFHCAVVHCKTSRTWAVCSLSATAAAVSGFTFSLLKAYI